ncbi:MAG: hypothetical protein BWX88_01626 [Planctomycetes bacterium ADurb.Bin126]|nr:MAG: hypothetical protein BWX88_01626 [Planctomycetes bacterium ADurb.Bin126]HOD82069.1 PepSY-like domain-containing protein [Phycisphaerae bacterium]HQL73537.1 PepSY-like domain-containing protein [Phycisphaerae bacterium]
MNARWILLSVAVCSLLLSSGACVNAKEVQVTIDQVPQAVRDAILKEAGEAKIDEIEKETKGDKVTYEAEWKVDGKEIEIKLAEDGTVLAREQEITLEQAPQAVREAILKAAGDNKVKEVSRITRGGKTFFEAEWKADGKEIEIKLAEDGTILKKQAEAEDKDDD